MKLIIEELCKQGQPEPENQNPGGQSEGGNQGGGAGGDENPEQGLGF